MMDNEERRRHISDLLQLAGKVVASDFKERFGTATMDKAQRADLEMKQQQTMGHIGIAALRLGLSTVEAVHRVAEGLDAANQLKREELDYMRAGFSKR